VALEATNVADEPFAAAEIRRLDELWLRASELAVEGDLAVHEANVERWRARGNGPSMNPARFAAARTGGRLVRARAAIRRRACRRDEWRAI
jgi:hypothetical protein